MFKARFSVSSVSKKVVSGLGLGASSILLSGTTTSGNVSAMFGKIVDTSSSMQDNSRGEGNTDEKFKNQSSSSYTDAYGSSYEQNNIVLEEEKKEGPGFFGKIGNVFGSIFSKKQENPQSENNTNGNVEDRSSSSYSNIQDNSYGQNNICLKEEEKKEGPGFFGKIGNVFNSIFNKDQENTQSENNINENVEDQGDSSYSNIVSNSCRQNIVSLKEEEEKKEGPDFFDKIRESVVDMKESVGEITDKFTSKIKSIFSSEKNEQKRVDSGKEREQEEKPDNDEEIVMNCHTEFCADENGEYNSYQRDFDEEGQEIGKPKINYEKKVDEIDNNNGDNFNIISMIIENVNYMKDICEEKENDIDKSENMIIEENKDFGDSYENHKNNISENTNVHKQNSFSLLNQGFSTAE